jgi:membrane protease YdiL (CAAX protease family)
MDRFRQKGAVSRPVHVREPSPVRLPRWLAWFLLGSAFLTAGLLRQFHAEIPRSPYVSPLVGSMLFAAVLFLLLVAAREWRLGAAPGPGIRLGSLTPLLLMLLLEKWISLGLYDPVFYFLTPAGLPDAELDARYRAFAGLGLLLTCALLSGFSPPSWRRTWRRLRPARWPVGILGLAAVVAAVYLALLGLAAALGGHLRFVWPAPGMLTAWILAGQALRAFSEEYYYRSLLLSEMQRLAPRLGAGGAAAARWAALIPTSLLFALEHAAIGPPWDEPLRRGAFTLALGLLLGLLMLATENLPFVAGIHAFVNWLVLGVAPSLADESRLPALPVGTYVGLTLALAFVLAFLARRRGVSRVSRSAGGRP